MCASIGAVNIIFQGFFFHSSLNAVTHDHYKLKHMLLEEKNLHQWSQRVFSLLSFLSIQLEEDKRYADMRLLYDISSLLIVFVN